MVDLGYSFYFCFLFYSYIFRVFWSHTLFKLMLHFLRLLWGHVTKTQPNLVKMCAEASSELRSGKNDGTFLRPTNAVGRAVTDNESGLSLPDLLPKPSTDLVLEINQLRFVHIYIRVSVVRWWAVLDSRTKLYGWASVKINKTTNDLNLCTLNQEKTAL